jgi:hypothetical protein
MYYVLAGSLPVAAFDGAMQMEHFLSGCRLFLYVKAHPHLQYYLKLHDTHRAANQDWLRTAQVVEIRAKQRESTGGKRTP